MNPSLRLYIVLLSVMVASITAGAAEQLWLSVVVGAIVWAFHVPLYLWIDAPNRLAEDESPSR